MKSNPRRILSAMLAILVMTMVLGGCGEDDESNPVVSEPAVLMPLAVDNNWSYRKITISYVGGGSHDITNTTFQIEQDTIIGEDTWYTANDGEYINGNDGLNINYYYFLGTYGPVVYRYPASVGDAYINPANEGSSTVIVTDIAKPIDVMAGQFLCYGFKTVTGSAGVTWSRQIYFAPGIGRVLTKSYTIGEEDDTTLYVHEELTGYVLH